MKRYYLMFLAFLAAFTTFGMVNSNDAQAQVSLELVGKLGTEANWIEKEWAGDTKVDVSGGLRFSGLVRFANNFGVGLNLNWTMSSQNLEWKESGLAGVLGDYSKRAAVVQHPSFGIMFRYLLIDMIDLGIWFNYGFGSVSFDSVEADTTKPEYDKNRGVWTGTKYHGYTSSMNLSYDLQTFEMGLLAHARWYIPNTTFAVIVGLEFFMNFSRMLVDDTTVAAITNDGKRAGYDENSINSFGFQFVFGVGYDFYFDAFGKQYNGY